MNISYRRFSVLSCWMFPVLIIVFISLPSVFSALLFTDELSLLIFAMTLVALAFYFFGYSVIGAITPKLSIEHSKKKERVVYWLLFLFISTNLYLYISYGSVPLLSAFILGESSVAARMQFMHFNDGIISEAIFYIRSIMMRGILPVLIVYLYTIKGFRGTFPLVVLLSIILVSTFEKANLFWVYFPLLLILLVSKEYKVFLKFLVIFVVSFVFVVVAGVSSILSKSQFPPDSMTASVVHVDVRNSPLSSDKHEGIPIEASTLLFQSNEHLSLSEVEKRNVDLKSVPNYQLILGSDNVFWYMVNRTFWIPFITAYDTILYWQIFYDGVYLGSRSNRHLARLFGTDFSDLEQEVFRFQFGGNYDSQGNANAAYIAEAFVIGGPLVVALFSALIGLVMRFLNKTRSSEGLALCCVSSFGLVNASFISMMFSGGIAFGLFFVFYLLKKN